MGEIPQRGWLARKAAERQEYIFRHSGLGLWMGSLAFVFAWLSILLHAIPALTVPLGVASVGLVLLCLADFAAVAVRDPIASDGHDGCPPPVPGSRGAPPVATGGLSQPPVTYWGSDEPAPGGDVPDTRSNGAATLTRPGATENPSSIVL